jgi:hypothetical protein
MKTKSRRSNGFEPASNPQNYFRDLDECVIYPSSREPKSEYKEYKTFRFTAEELAEFRKQDEKNERAELRRLRLLEKNGPGKNIHLFPCGEKWGIRNEGDSRFLRIYKTKTEARRKGLSIASDRRADFFEHRRTGRVLVWKTYPWVRRDTKR